jgi:S-adenosylmethionine decarboxylase
LNALGIHILLELKGCDKGLLNDLTYVRETLVEVAREVSATIIGESFHRFQPQGITGILAIAESHICIHTWPEHGYAAVDVFTCGETVQASKAAELLIQRFHAGDHSQLILERGPLSRHLLGIQA